MHQSAVHQPAALHKTMLQHALVVCGACALALFCAVPPLDAQPLDARQKSVQQNAVQPESRFTRFGAAEGLLQGSIQCMCQDRYGFLWCGTQDGLTRFDGYGFTVFRHDPQDSTTLSDSYINTIVEDRAGTLWVGTESGGLNRFNRATETFSRYTNDAANPASLSNNRIYALLEDRSTNDPSGKHGAALWVGTNGGLNRFDRTTGKFTRYTNEPANLTSLSNNSVWALLEDRAGMLWVGTDGGLNRFDRGTGQFTRFANDPTHSVSSTSLSSNSVRALLEDHAGALWVGTDGGGLNCIDRATGRWNHYANDATNPNSLSNNRICALLEDHAGILWVGTDGGGLNRFDRTTGTYTRYTNDATNPASLSHNRVFSLVEDRTGMLWVGTGGDLNRFDREAKVFITHTNNPNNPASLSNNSVRALLEEHSRPQTPTQTPTQTRSQTNGSGVLWVGTYGGGLNRFDRTTKTFTCYKNNPADPTSLSNNIVRVLLEDRGIISDNHNDGTALWVGTDRGGLNHLDCKTGRFTRYAHNTADPTSLSSNSVRALLEDHGGGLWVGTDGGLNRLDRATGKFTRYVNNPTDPTSLSNNNVRVLMKDRMGTLWVGTAGGGLNRFDYDKGTFTRYQHDAHNSASLSHDRVSSIVEDSTGALWVGTVGGGLNRFDRTNASSGRFTAFREKDGLPNDAVYGVLEDAIGNLWLSTNKGLCCFNPRAKTFKTFDERDGLQGNEFNAGAYHLGESGRMYFGGGNGFNEFFPDSVRFNTLVPPVFITGFKLFGKPTWLDSAIIDTKRIALAYDQNSISFEFLALNFIRAEKNLYTYKLEGFDKEWSSVGTERKAIYTNLDAGEYTFCVKGSNNDGIWNDFGTRIVIVISPPWWKTWWFRLFLCCALVVAAAAEYKRRVRTIQERADRLERVVVERTKELHESNEHLKVANAEIHHQMEVLAEQSVEIELANTQLQETNSKLHERNEELQHLNEEKNEFLGIAAHDLKNPLAGIKLAAGLIRRNFGKMPRHEIEDRLQMIEKTADRMATITGNLLNVNALEMGKLNLEIIEVELSALLTNLVSEYHERAAAKRIALRFVNTHGEVCIATDKNALYEVLENLISNALKFSSAHTTITISLVSNREMCRIAVQDEGPGLSEADKNNLFGKFARLTAQPTAGENSTGLGLSIVKKLVEAIGGQVWCESQLGKGATFFLEFRIHTHL